MIMVFFDRNLDLVLGTAYIWSRPRRWLLTKWINWIRLLLSVAGPATWREFRTDFRYLVRALGQVLPRYLTQAPGALRGPEARGEEPTTREERR